MTNRLLPFAFWAALAITLIMALLPKPPTIPGNPSDKIQHILAFAALSGLASVAYPKMGLVRIGVLLTIVGAMIEVLQSVPLLHRDSNVADWVADTIAIAVVLVVVRLFRTRTA